MKEDPLGVMHRYPVISVTTNANTTQDHANSFGEWWDTPPLKTDPRIRMRTLLDKWFSEQEDTTIPGNYIPPIESDPSRNIYDLLRTLIEKVHWSDEGEKREYLEFVTYAEQLRAFGDRLDIRKDRK